MPIDPEKRAQRARLTGHLARDVYPGHLSRPRREPLPQNCQSRNPVRSRWPHLCR
jgi:hypothetical protein